MYSYYRDRLESMQILLSRTQAGPGRTDKQEQEEISRNHVQPFISPLCSSGATVRDLLAPCHSLTGRVEVGGSGKLTIKREQLICRRWQKKGKERRKLLTQNFPPLYKCEPKY